MSTINLHTIQTIERESSSLSLRLSSVWLNTLSFLKKIHSWSFKVWFNKKLIKSFTELNVSLKYVNENFDELSMDDKKNLYEISSSTINRFVQLKELLAEVNYFDNQQLNESLNECLTTLIISEAKSKKIAKAKKIGEPKEDERELKNILSAKSKASLSAKF